MMYTQGLSLECICLFNKVVNVGKIKDFKQNFVIYLWILSIGPKCI